MGTWILLVGFVSLVAQVLLLRELATLFCGNELFLSATLASWLLLAAAGSALAGRLGDRLRNPRAALLAGLAALGALLPLTLLWVRAAPLVLLASTGAQVSFGRMVLITLALLAPLCVVIGFLFAVACRVAGGNDAHAAGGITRAYVLEAAGTAIGGVAFTFLLAPAVPPLLTTLLLGIFLIGAASVAWPTYARSSRLVLLPAWLIGALFVVMLAPPRTQALEFASRAWRLHGYVLVDARDSRYGRIDVARREGQYAIFENGVLIATNETADAAERLVHLPLLAHPRPQRLLIAGGAAAGVLRKALEHHPQAVDYVELDPELIAVAAAYADPADRAALRDPRVTVHHDVDARLFLRRTAHRYDAIIVDQPDPTTAAANRFYTLEFSREARARLAPGGLLALEVSTSPGYIVAEQRWLLKSVLRTLRAAFAEVAVFPCDGATVFAATADKGALQLDASVLVERLRGRGIDAHVMYAEAVRQVLDPFLRWELMSQLQGVGETPLNRDDRPISYYYGILLGHRTLSGRPGPAAWLAGLDVLHVAVAAFALALAVGALGRLLRRPRQVATLAALAFAGFGGITLEVVLLFAFQSLYGYVYSYIGVIFAAFMVGLVLGGLLGGRRGRKAPTDDESWALRRMTLAVGVMVGYAALLPVLFHLADAAPAALQGIIARVGFPLLTLAAGLLAGTCFALGARAFGVTRDHASRAGGLLYASDMAGSFCGALLAGAALAPLLGLATTCYAVAVALLAAVALLLACWQ